MGVTCASATYCIGVGRLPSGDSLVEENLGGGWEIVHGAPNSSLGHVLVLNKIECSATTHCIIVGSLVIDFGAAEAFTHQT